MPFSVFAKFRDYRKLRQVRKSVPTGKVPLALHGIQRSGTNYTQACLTRISVLAVNTVLELERDDPRHKHFRWYRDKTAIPDFLQDQYGNQTNARDLAELTKQANHPANCAHLVMQKEKLSWLASICNWGIRVNWFPPDPTFALRELATLAKDYDAYYAFWSNLADQNPRRIKILQLENISRDFCALTDTLDELNVGFNQPPDFDGRIKEVDQSPEDRVHTVTKDDVRQYLGMT